MDLHIKKTICVTGATSGIGRATAVRFAKDGWHIVAIGRREERLKSLAQQLGDACTPILLDVRCKDAVFAAFESLSQKIPVIDVLVNNAGGAHGLDPVQSASLDDWETMIDTNIKGLTYCTKAVVNQMAQRRSGHIINIGSIAGFTSYLGANVYGATKAFVSQFSQNLRSDLHGSGVRITLIEPGCLESEFSLVRFKGDVEKANAVYEGIDPLLPEDIADAIFYAVSAPQHVNINRMEIMPVCQSQRGTRIGT